MTPPRIFPTLLDTWVNFGGAFEDLTYWRGADQIVRLQGLVKNGTIGNAIFTLDAGYRPASGIDFAVDSNSAHGRVRIDAAGNVNCDVGNNAYVTLSGISFRAAP